MSAGQEEAAAAEHARDDALQGTQHAVAEAVQARCPPRAGLDGGGTGPVGGHAAVSGLACLPS